MQGGLRAKKRGEVNVLDIKRAEYAAIEREANRRGMSYGQLVAALSKKDMDKVIEKGVAEMREEEKEARRLAREKAKRQGKRK